MLRFATTYNGQTKQGTVDGDSAVLGRNSTASKVDLDLAADRAVSRQHARIWLADGKAFVEDLGSSYGTFVNGKPVPKREAQELAPGDTVQVGDTEVRLVPADGEPGPAGTGTPAAATPGGLQVASRCDARTFPAALPLPPPAPGTPSTVSLGQFIRLPALLAAAADLDAVLKTAVQGVMSVFPTADSAAILLRDRQTRTRYLLKAHCPEGKPVVSGTLARQAADYQEAILWSRPPPQPGLDALPTVSLDEFGLQCVMVVPLVWHDDILGVLSLHSSVDPAAFDRDHLTWLVALAHHLAACLAHRQLLEDNALNLRIMDRLMPSFSPQVRQVLIDRARMGRLQPGGEKSEVTILFADIRGFSKLAAELDSAALLELLNAYFSVLTDCVLGNDGTLDKFIGDALLAVFGSPVPDPQQQEKALLAASRMCERMAELSEMRRVLRQPTCEVGIGIHCGEVLHGLIGSPDRLEFTVIGDTVNRASRYCDAAGAGDILLSPEVHQRAWRSIRTEPCSFTTKHGEVFAAHRFLGFRHPVMKRADRTTRA